MGAAELTRQARPRWLPPSPKPRRPAPRWAAGVNAVYAALWALTCLGAATSTVLPGLAPTGRPHPTLSGSVADIASIAASNARVLSAPFLLALFRFPAGRRSRQLGDLLVGGVLAENALRVGFALGRWHTQLLPYLPQLPLEWLAAAMAGTAWLELRNGARNRTAIAYLAAVLALVAAGAIVEAAASPHVSAPGTTLGDGQEARLDG